MLLLRTPKKVSISLDRYEGEFGDFEFTTFEDGMSDYLIGMKMPTRSQIDTIFRSC